MPRELVRPVLPSRRHPRLGAVAAGALLVFLFAGWAYASRSAATRSDDARIHVEHQRRTDVDAAYRTATGAEPEPKTGAARCVDGEPDERSWSRPEAPARAVGRFSCRVVDGRAEMWWTEGNTLSHALAPDADIAALYAWWLEQ